MRGQLGAAGRDLEGMGGGFLKMEIWEKQGGLGGQGLHGGCEVWFEDKFPVGPKSVSESR